MSFYQAFVGAKAELTLLPPAQRLGRLAIYARVIAAELLGVAAAVPFGVRAAALHRSLPDARAGRSGTRVHRGSSVSILRGVRYSARPRNTLDIYLPPAQGPEDPAGPAPGAGAAASASQSSGGGASSGEAAGTEPCCGSGGGRGGGTPVVLFCHGGVWATGASWHYAPMATRLAQAGVLTAGAPPWGRRLLPAAA